MAAEVRRVGRYAMYDAIGAGGMATVHLGRLCGPAGFASIVALKTLKAPFKTEAEFVAMLKDEARVASSVRHPNVARVIDVIEEGSEFVLVMEYVHGESLRGLIREHGGPFPPAIAAAIICGILAGLHAAHEATGEGNEPLGIIHRDISPHNVIVGVDGFARVVDFGIAKARGRAQATTQAGQIKGKLTYMPPEQIHGEEVTRRVDLWATGVLFWELLTGVPLFGGEGESALVKAVLFDDIQAPSHVAPELPPALDAVVLRALSREPSRRFATAKEMELAIERCITIASPTTVGEWVVGRAHAKLEDRTRLIEALSRSASVAEAASESTEEQTLAPAPRPRLRLPLPALLALATSVIAIGVTAAVMAGGHPAARSVNAPAEAPTPSAEPIAATPSAPLRVSVAEEPSPPPTPEPSVRKAVRPPPKTPRPDCDPPYSLNARGEKIYRRECFPGAK
jgi:serine/threonine-protein kinase